MCRLPNSVAEFIQNGKDTLAFNCARTVTDSKLTIVEFNTFQSLQTMGFLCYCMMNMKPNSHFC